MKPTTEKLEEIKNKKYMDLTFCGTFLVCGTCDHCVLKAMQGESSPLEVSDLYEDKP